MPSVDVTSTSGNGSDFSPFTLGPVMLYSNTWSRNMENGWQYAKVYPEHVQDYWTWAKAGWDNPRAVRYPMGKGAKPLYSLWCGEGLGYIAARKRIYMPLYSQAIRFYRPASLQWLREQAARGDIAIKDYDAYDHRTLGYSWDDVINDPSRKMGHGFVLAMMLEGVL
jgi:uncharacterized protein DUF6939